MTRKTAIIRAIEILNRDSENSEIVKGLEEVLTSLPHPEWTKESILDAIETFREENGRLPLAKEFSSKNKLPAGHLIPHRFQVSVGQFLAQNYPEAAADRYRDAFISNYQKIREKLGAEIVPKWLYEKERDRKSPDIENIKRKLGYQSYREMVKATITSEKKKPVVTKRYPEGTELSKNLEINEYLKRSLAEGEKE